MSDEEELLGQSSGLHHGTLPSDPSSVDYILLLSSRVTV